MADETGGALELRLGTPELAMRSSVEKLVRNAK